MRRQNGIYGKVVVGIIVVVILGISVFYLANKNNLTEAYREYVSSFEQALLEYSDKELGQEYSTVVYEYDVLENLLIEKGYLEKLEDENVKVSALPITLSKTNWNTTFYNYNNTTTFENRFEVIFQKGNKEYTCTKNSCN